MTARYKVFRVLQFHSFCYGGMTFSRKKNYFILKQGVSYSMMITEMCIKILFYVFFEGVDVHDLDTLLELNIVNCYYLVVVIATTRFCKQAKATSAHSCGYFCELLCRFVDIREIFGILKRGTSLEHQTISYRHFVLIVIFRLMFQTQPSKDSVGSCWLE